MIQALRLLGIGWFFAISIVGGTGLGFLLDGWAGMTPLFSLIGLAIGLLVATYGGYRLLVQFTGDNVTGKDANGV
jgi:F0F1-type ATP synthase assembly protein I